MWGVCSPSRTRAVAHISPQATIEIIKRDEDGNFDLGSPFWSYFPPKKPFVYAILFHFYN